MSSTDVVDQMVAGTVAEDHELAGLVAALQTRDEFRARDDMAARMGAELAQVAREANRGRTPANQGRRLRRRLAPVLVSGVLLAGMTGVAIAADNAVPGDFLYPLDRALEVVGIGAGGPEERIFEAQVMFEDGRVAEAVAHAKEAIADSDNPVLAEAVENLEKAAERIDANKGLDDGGPQPADRPDSAAVTDGPDRSRPGVGMAEDGRAGNQPSTNADERARVGSGNANQQPDPANKPEEPRSQGGGDPSPGSGNPSESPGGGPKPDAPGSGGPPEGQGKGGQGPPTDPKPGESTGKKSGGGKPDKSEEGKP